MEKKLSYFVYKEPLYVSVGFLDVSRQKKEKKGNFPAKCTVFGHGQTVNRMQETDETSSPLLHSMNERYRTNVMPTVPAL